MAAALLLYPSLAPAQGGGEVILYSEIGFRGQTYAMNGPRDFIRLGWPVRSVWVGPGGSWQLCSAPQYRGRCQTADRSVANILWYVGSGRPATGGPVTLPAPVPGSGTSLRGMASEFFPTPSDGRGRVFSCPSGAAACAAASANNFCRSRGWTRSAYQRQETIAGRIYLADVLCVRA